MPIEEKIIISTSGKTLPLRIRTPDAPPKGVVQINTGTCIPQKIYWRFAEFLTENGYVTITYDYSDAQNFSSTVSHTDWIKDMESVFDFVLREFPCLKKIIVGHSSGGQLLGMMYNCSMIDRVYLVASASGYWKLLKFPYQFALLFFLNVIVPVNIRVFGYFNNKIFGSGGGFPSSILLELRSFCFQPDFFAPFFKSKNIPSHYHEITAPLKAYHLQGDIIANEKACRYITELYTHSDRSFITLNPHDYGVKKFGHRSFFSSGAEKLWLEFLEDLGK